MMKISKSKHLDIDAELVLSPQNCIGQRWNVDATIRFASNVELVLLQFQLESFKKQKTSKKSRKKGDINLKKVKKKVEEQTRLKKQTNFKKWIPQNYASF